MRDHLAACACRGLVASLALKDSKLFATRSTCISITRSKPSRTGIHTIGVRVGKLIDLFFAPLRPGARFGFTPRRKARKESSLNYEDHSSRWLWRDGIGGHTRS